MERSWSEAARAAFEAYPWSGPREKARAREEAELVSFGEQVEVADLPLAVRQWLRGHRPAGPFAGWTWRGESWKALTEGFEKAILSQALAAHGGFAAKAARALGTTPRVVAYKARKYGLTTKQNQKQKRREG
ncbi:MAG: helix-turn-helix domain-containing protein [Kiritimatiellia bacterium]